MEHKKTLLLGHHKHESMEITLLDSTGKIIYSTEDFEIFQNESKVILSKIIGQQSDIAYFLGSNDESIEKQKLFAYYQSRGYNEFKGLGWILLIEHKTDELFAPINNLVTYMIIITIFISLFAILFALLLSHSFSKPITKVTEIASEYSKGNLDKKINIKSQDEIGALASAFENMAESLKNQQNNLENLILQRTKDLDKKIKELEKYKKVTVGRELKMVELKKKIKGLEEKWGKNQLK